MRLVLLLCLCALGPAILAQANFELQPGGCVHVFPAGCGAGGDPEAVSGNNLALATVDSTPNTAGFPCKGMQYARLNAFGPVTVPSGGPYPGGGNELYIPIVSPFELCWDFYNAETFNSTTFNDGMSIDLVAADCTTTVANLVYADTFNTPGPGSDFGGCSTFGVEIDPTGVGLAGPQTLTIVPTAGAIFVRIAVWNAGDNAVASKACVDLGPICSLQMSGGTAPGGYQIAVLNQGCTPGAIYLTVLTLNAGSFPNGYWFGIDPVIGELLIQIMTPAPPFNGFLDASGGSVFTLLLPGGPLGITVYGVTISHDFTNILDVTQPVMATL